MNKSMWETDWCKAMRYVTYVVIVRVNGWNSMCFAHYNGYDWIKHKSTGDYYHPYEKITDEIIKFTSISQLMGELENE